MTTSEQTQRNLAYAFIGGYYIIILAVLFFPIQEAQQQIANILVGTLTVSVAAIIGFYYGTSMSSNKKTDILAAQQKVEAKREEPSA